MSTNTTHTATGSVPMYCSPFCAAYGHESISDTSVWYMLPWLRNGPHPDGHCPQNAPTVASRPFGNTVLLWQMTAWLSRWSFRQSEHVKLLDAQCTLPSAVPLIHRSTSTDD